MARALDLSNFTTAFDVNTVRAWQANTDVQLGIIQAIDLITGSRRQGMPLERQFDAFLQAGIPTDAYVFLWFGQDLSVVRQKLALLSDKSVRKLWLDIEDQTPYADRVGYINSVLALCDDFCAKRGIPRTGIYTGSWFWVPQMNNTTAFADRDLWDSHFDNAQDTRIFKPYGGWTRSCLKQYAGDVVLEGVSGMDISVLAEGELDSVANVPQVPQDYLNKFALSGPYDWPGVVANLEGIIHSLVPQHEEVKAEVVELQNQLEADKVLLGKIREALA